MRQTTINKIRKDWNKKGLRKLSVFFAKTTFKFFERYFQLHITPVHFYSPIPTTCELDPGVFQKVYDCDGIDWNLTKQLEYLGKVFPKYDNECQPTVNSGLSLVDAFILHAMIREKKPKVMVEVSAGDTTKISLNALDMNEREGAPYKFYSIEPYPREDILALNNSNFGLIHKKVQEVSIDLLSSADLLLID